jgi:hypothetical protein
MTLFYYGVQEIENEKCLYLIGEIVIRINLYFEQKFVEYRNGREWSIVCGINFWTILINRIYYYIFNCKYSIPSSI